MTVPATRSPNRPGRWDPLREFEDLYGQMGRWMDSVFSGGDGEPAWSPAADVRETEDSYLVEVDLPGVRRDDLAIDLTGGELAVTGELREVEQRGRLHRRTRRTGQFAYRVTLPHDVDTDSCEAGLTDGVLTIRVPKSETAKPHRITISGP